MARFAITCPNCGGAETYEVIANSTQSFSCKACRKTIRVEFDQGRVKRVFK